MPDNDACRRCGKPATGDAQYHGRIEPLCMACYLGSGDKPTPPPPDASAPKAEWDGAAYRLPGEPAYTTVARALWNRLHAGAWWSEIARRPAPWDRTDSRVLISWTLAVSGVLDQFPQLLGRGDPGRFTEFDRVFDAHKAAVTAGDHNLARGFAREMVAHLEGLVSAWRHEAGMDEVES